MTTHSNFGRRSLPERPDLRHLKQQAKDLLQTGSATSLAEAQFQIARSYGFPSWPKLKVFVESFQEIGQLKDAIDSNDVNRVITMMTRNPGLHSAPLGYRKNGPLTWVAECRVPWEPPSQDRLAIARWMLEHGSDVHQGGDGPLMRAALVDDRIPMMELLLAYGANVNALWSGYFPIIFAPCETLAPASLNWLLDHGADPNCADPEHGITQTALDYVVRTYSRSPRQATCIDILLAAGGTGKYAGSIVFDLLRGRLDRLAAELDKHPALLHQRFPELDFGATARRRLALKGGTLLHVAAEYGNVEAAKLLLDRGADVNARALVDENGVGGQTPIFHSASQFYDYGLAVTQLLLERGANPSIRAKLPGEYDTDQVVDANALEYAELFPGTLESKTLSLLRSRSQVG